MQAILAAQKTLNAAIDEQYSTRQDAIKKLNGQKLQIVLAARAVIDLNRTNLPIRRWSLYTIQAIDILIWAGSIFSALPRHNL
jgi:hypothetical protein